MSVMSPDGRVRIARGGVAQSGLFVQSSVPPGGLICELGVERRLREPTRFSVQISASRHVEPVAGRWINHGCDPNARIDCDDLTVRALRSIPAGGEVTFFYPSTEWSMAEPFACLCGARACVGQVRGARDCTALIDQDLGWAPHILDAVTRSRGA